MKSVKSVVRSLFPHVILMSELVFDTSKPDGTPRKLLDVSRLHALGWRHCIAFEEGIPSTCQWFLENKAGEEVKR